MRDLLGGKGSGLAEMSNLGLPVPPGFTITTEACRAYMEAGEIRTSLMESVTEYLGELEEATGKRLGDSGGPAPRLGPERRGGLDAGDDGHGLEPWPQRHAVEGLAQPPVTNASPGTPTGASSRCSARSCSG